MKIIGGGLDDLRVQKLLAYHFSSARAETAPGSAHALDLSGLKSPDVVFWSAWDGKELMGVGALKRLSASHGEIKSMRTVTKHLRKGVARAVLNHIIDEAKRRGYTRLSLETGAMPEFEPARRLYAKAGFSLCQPFGDYVADPNSVFMTMKISDK